MSTDPLFLNSPSAAETAPEVRDSAPFRPNWPMRIGRTLLTAVGLIALWQVLVWLTGAPSFMLPGPRAVFDTLVSRPGLLLSHAWVTALEIVAGLAFGVMLGCFSAMLLLASRRIERWLLPLLVISQALPVFALAPLLTLWLGYGIGAKIAMAVLIIYFPVTAALFDGLRHTEPLWLEQARVMGASRAATLRHIRLPAALPALGSGLRVAAAVAPIGAVVGEWVGASRGLGYLMLHANGRMQTDLLFAALFVLALIAVTVYWLIDRLAVRLAPWQASSR